MADEGDNDDDGGGGESLHMVQLHPFHRLLGYTDYHYANLT